MTGTSHTLGSIGIVGQSELRQTFATNGGEPTFREFFGTIRERILPPRSRPPKLSIGDVVAEGTD